MDSIASALGLGGLGFAVAVLVLVGTLAVLIAAFRPNRQYLGVERGRRPEPGAALKTTRAAGGEPPVRFEKPDMSPAEAGYVYRDCDGVEMVLSTIVDLAARRFLDIIEYQELAIPRPTVIIVTRRTADGTCTRQEKALLDLLAVPGAAEAPDFIRARPFNPVHFRAQLRMAGVSRLGSPSARVAGMRRSVAELFGRDVAKAAVDERKWYDRWRDFLGSVGALMLLGGGLVWLVSLLLWLLGALSGYWCLLFGLVSAVGAVTFVGTEGRTAEGTVARDQACGFRRFLVEAPQPPGDAEELARFAGWAIALGCVDEWAKSLERLGSHVSVDEAVPWLVSTRGRINTWRDVADVIEFMQARIHAEGVSKDSKTPLPRMSDGWEGVESFW
ncbi:DUF2207 family protein [Peptidiphaga sp.]|uniref:DUF2207 family protein n=1 Tax=Peptidiphaga sp. TaxID=2848648 RepID=UPI003606FEEC